MYSSWRRELLSNKFNLQSMLLTKSSSLPHIHHNYNKFEQFFTQKNHAKQVLIDEPHYETYNPEALLTSQTNHPSHARNLEFIQRKSTLRSKVDSYLTNSTKLGILDHTRHEIHNRKSLTKVSQQSLKPFKTELEQQSSYLTKLKAQLNFYSEKNRRAQSSIKNTQAMMNEIKQKIIFYEQLLSRSWVERAQLLKQRQQNIVYIRFQSDRFNYMKQRLKSINLWMKVQVRQSQKKLKEADLDFNKIVEVECNEQAELDRKKYLLQQYYNYQAKQSEEVAVQTLIATKNLQQHQAAEILKQKQDRITIMEPIDYLNENRINTHQKLIKQLVFQKFFSKMLAAIAQKYSSYYKSYEKAQHTIKMHCMDRSSLVQDSYKKSFQVTAELKAKIQQKEAIIKQLQKRKEFLQGTYEQCYFKQNQEQQKRLSSVQLQYKTGKKLLKQAKKNEIEEFEKACILRKEQTDLSRSLFMRLKQWAIRQKQSLDISISKNLPLVQHFKKIIETVGLQLKHRQASFNLTQLAAKEARPGQLSNKKGVLKKRK